MPKEINRIVADKLADVLFTPSVDGDQNLAREGVRKEKVLLVGNVMIDTLIQFLPMADYLLPTLQKQLNVDSYGVVTLHRPSNVDDESAFLPILKALDPLGYLLALEKSAKVVLTDSGGIQEETTYLGTPCITLRENTERPITVTCSTNVLVGHDLEKASKGIQLCPKDCASSNCFTAALGW
jgi:UDP-N-acetylglucosamine 2-epimerase (non-hydrolysing)